MSGRGPVLAKHRKVLPGPEHNLTAARRCILTIWRGFTLAALIALLGAGDSWSQAAPRGLVEVPRGGRAGLWGGLGLGAGGESFDLLDGVG
jgi:hypothetical protein